MIKRRTPVLEKVVRMVEHPYSSGKNSSSWERSGRTERSMAPGTSSRSTWSGPAQHLDHEESERRLYQVLILSPEGHDYVGGLTFEERGALGLTRT